MLAYLRYRRIGYEFLIANQADSLGLPRAKVELLPTFYLPNDRNELEAVVDSTPLIRRFEREFAGRSTLPPDPVLSFLNYLIEDYADEWLTKAMFHYRWHYAPDIDKAAAILPRWRALDASDADLDRMSRFVAERQIARLYVVGSNEITAPVIEDSYRRFLGVFDRMVKSKIFVFGERPASADFGIYAQLTQLAKFDPTPAAICLADTPRLTAWTDIVDDLSGHPGDASDWLETTAAAARVADLLAEVGRVYAPALIANAMAIESGNDRFETQIDGRRWTQPTFAYQGKCLQWIVEEYRKLDTSARHAVDRALAGTGCEAIVSR
jgi:glutathione S-transferase